MPEAARASAQHDAIAGPEPICFTLPAQRHAPLRAAGWLKRDASTALERAFAAIANKWQQKQERRRRVKQNGEADRLAATENRNG